MQPSLSQPLPAAAPVCAPAKQDICDQKNPLLNKAILPPPPPPPPTKKKKILAKISNPKNRDHSGKKSTAFTNWAILEAAQLKGAGYAELRKREHETINWEEIVVVVFFNFLLSRLPHYLMRAWNRVSEHWHRGLFFSQVLVLIYTKNLSKRPNK